MRHPPDPGLPSLLGALRRRRRVSAGPPSVWEVWDTSTGERALVRAVHPEEEPLLAGLPPLPLPVELVAGTTSTPAIVRTGPFTCSLADLLPIDDAPGSAWTARVALGAFAALAALHGAGHAHGWIGPESVVATAGGWTLAWLGPGAAGGTSAAADVHALSVLVTTLDPDGPLVDLVGTFVECPPPSAADATRLLLHACAATLAREHHILVRRARELGAASGRARLRRLAGRLRVATPPPRAQGRVSVDDEGVALVVESDGAAVTAWFGAPSGRFPVWGPGGLDPLAARFLLRAWARRQAPEDAEVSGLMRWLGAASRLRVDELVLARL